VNIFNDLFLTLQQTINLHCHETPFYRFTHSACEKIIQESDFIHNEPCFVNFGDFGDICLPYYSMGNIDSLKLFGLDEMIIFSFYLANKNNYKKVADMGANIGLHSILMSRLGWEVTAFEPDPVHVKKIEQHIDLNQCKNISIRENAISDSTESLVFTRLTGNRTGSHLKGYKDNVYGDVDEFSVKCLALSGLMKEFDFIKMDIEGAEASAICSTLDTDWLNTDVMLEVGSVVNAEKIWAHAEKLSINIFAQKIAWGKVNNFDDMPTSYKEGSIFLTNNESMNFT